MNPMPIAGHHPLLLPLNTSLSHWTDHAARTKKCGLPVGSACWPSVPEFPLTLGHARSGVGTVQAKFPPASVRRLGYDVVRTLTRFYEVGGPALHACLRPTGIRSTRLSQGETPVSTKNQSAVTGLSPSLDEPCRTHRKVWPASELGLLAVRPRIPAHTGHTRPGPRAANSLLRRSCADG